MASSESSPKCGAHSLSECSPSVTTPTAVQHLENEMEEPDDSNQAHNPTQTQDDGHKYPTGIRLALIILALCMSVFLMALDNSIIATAIPKITDQFNSLSDVGWYGSAYFLAIAALQLLYGKFYSYFSVKWMYLGAIGLFELGSLICGAANSSMMLIIGRAIAGLGSAGIFSGAIIILAHSAPLERRPMYTAIIGSMYGIASVAGPLLGGVFTDKATWRWCFLINLPLGAITVPIIVFCFRDPRPSTTVVEKDSPFTEKIKRFDPIGTILFMPSIICLLLALQWGGTTYPWSDGRVIALLVMFGLLLTGFLLVQYSYRWSDSSNATIPPHIISRRTVWASAMFIFASGAAFASNLYFLPIWFQAVKGASAVESGLMNLPMLISMIAMTIVAAMGVTAIGYYAPFMLAATVLMPIGYGLMTTFSPQTGRAMWIGYQVLAGLGMGLGMQQPLIAVQTVLSTADIPVGASIIIFVQTLGNTMFVSIAETVFENKLVEYVQQYVPGLDPKIVLAVGATNIQAYIPAAMLPGVTLAYNNALTQAFLLSAVMAATMVLGSTLVEWRSVKGRNLT